jgi:hypothetical protein
MSSQKRHKNFATWAGAVKEWNRHQAFRDELYGIPKKGSYFYDEVFELFYGKPEEESKIEPVVPKKRVFKVVSTPMPVDTPVAPVATPVVPAAKFNRIPQTKAQQIKRLQDIIRINKKGNTPYGLLTAEAKENYRIMINNSVKRAEIELAKLLNDK